jgi:hypothetical protein
VIFANPQSDTVSPVDADDLAAWLGDVDPDEPTLPGILIAATDAVISYLNRDILPREWVATSRPQPAGVPTLHIPLRAIDPWIELPFAGLLSVERVLVDDVATTEFEADTDSRPGRVRLNNAFTRLSSKITIEYTAGFAEVPGAILEAIRITAGYLYEHRGACDMGNAVTESGASGLLSRYKIEVGL